MSWQERAEIRTTSRVDQMVVHELAGGYVTGDDAGAEPGCQGEQNGGGDRPGPPG